MNDHYFGFHELHARKAVAQHTSDRGFGYTFGGFLARACRIAAFRKAGCCQANACAINAKDALHGRCLNKKPPRRAAAAVWIFGRRLVAGGLAAIVWPCLPRRGRPKRLAQAEGAPPARRRLARPGEGVVAVARRANRVDRAPASSFESTCERRERAIGCQVHG
jgi:hypothetical protein